LTFLIEYLDLKKAVDDPEAKWEAFQLSHLNNTSLLAIELKSRQVGWSWLAAAESVAKSHIKERSTSIFISINLEEASEKIRYAKYIQEALDPEVRKKLVIDNKLELEFENGSRIISHPCRPVRGKAKANLYLDEFAHYPNDVEIYQSALPVLSKGGSLRIGSSPLGARGRFWEIYTESMQTYPGYVRQAIPWWHIQSFCKDVKKAKKLAPMMTTRQRVAVFGNLRIVQIYENSPLDDFQQEYECAWLDETVSWIDWDLIKRNQTLAMQGNLWYRMAQGVDGAIHAIDEVSRAISIGDCESMLAGGYDVGRKKDTSELILLGRNIMGQFPFRLNVMLDRVEFKDQLIVLKYAMDNLPVTNLLIDKNGIGMNLAENMEEFYPDRAHGVEFTNTSKQLWSVNAKLKAQSSQTPLPLERDLIYQIHSVKKKVSGSNNLIFECDTNEPHHADKYWAWVLALYAVEDGVFESGVDYNNPLIGYRG